MVFAVSITLLFSKFVMIIQYSITSLYCNYVAFSGIIVTMTKGMAIFEKVLSESGNKLTHPRRAVFECLSEFEVASMNQIISALDKQVNRVSVYRIIDLYEKLGVVNRLTIGWKYKIELSEMFKDHHHHLACSRCNVVVDIKDDEYLEGYVASVAKKHGFVAKKHNFEIEGICADCQAKINSH